MNVVLDTNVAVGAAITPKGPPAQIIRAWRAAAFIWITSNALLDELERAFTYPRIRRYLTWSDSQVAEFLDELRRVVLVARVDEELQAVERDPDDNRVLEAAVAGDAQYIVTNDNDLLNLRFYQEIEIVTAARFVSLLSQDYPSL